MVASALVSAGWAALQGPALHRRMVVGGGNTPAYSDYAACADEVRCIRSPARFPPFPPAQMSPQSPFDFRLPTRIVFGPGRIGELGDLARGLGATRALVASDSGVISAGHTEQGIASLEAAGISVMLFDGVHENPTTEHVEAGFALAKEFRPDLIVGLGGGIDTQVG